MLVPINRHLLVEPTENKEKEPARVLVPDSSIQKPPYSLVKLLAVASDCEKFNGEVGSTLLVNTGMVEEIVVGHEKYNIILENHVVGLYYLEDGTEER